MTAEEQQHAIAIEVGFSAETIAARMDYELALRQHQVAEIGAEEFYKRHLRLDPVPAAIPDFLRDLNAMAEAVEDWTFSIEKTRRFSNHLMVVIQDERCIESAVDARYFTVNATASQRAEAFLKTIGKWKE